MDLTKVIKIRSVENAVYSPQYNRMRFKIPEDSMNTHLNESYVSFQVVPVDAAGNTIPVGSSNNLSFGNADANLEYYASCLLKVVRLFRGDSNVPLEEIRHFNILDLNMKVYTKGFDDLISDQFENGFVVEEQFGAKQSSFFNEGSTFVFTEVHIPLKDIFGLCKNKDFHLSETGGLLIEFELEDQYKLFVQDTTPFKTFPGTDLVPVITPISTTNNVYNPLNGAGEPLQLGNEETNIAVPDDRREWKPVYLGVSNFTLSALDAATKTLKDSTFTIALTPGILHNNEATSYVGNTAQAAIINQADTNIPAYLTFRSKASGNYVTCPLANWNVTTPWSATGPTACIITASPVMPAIADPTGIDDMTIVFVHTLTSLKKWIYLDACNATTAPTNVPENYAFVGQKFVADFLKSNKNLVYNATGADDLAEINVEGAFNNGQTLIETKVYEIYYRVIFDDIADAKAQLLPMTGFANFDNLLACQLNLNKKDPQPITVTCTDAAGTLSFGISGRSLGGPKTGFTTPSYHAQVFLRMKGNSSEVSVGDFENSDISYQIPRAELVLFQSEKKDTDSISSVYKTWKWEAANIEYNVDVWNRQFILEPNVHNCYLMFLTQDTTNPANNSMASYMQYLDAYRWAINNVDNTNRDVGLASHLHMDKLIDTFNNSDVPLKNLSVYENGGSIIPMKIYDARDEANVYMNNTSCTLQLKLVAGADEVLDRVPLYLFKEMFKSL